MSKTQTPAAPRRQYEEQFKADAVRPLENGQRSVPDVAKSLGISTNLLYRWRDLAQAGKGQVANQAELAQLREQLRRTEQERDILKSIDRGGPVDCPRQHTRRGLLPLSIPQNQAPCFYWYAS